MVRDQRLRHTGGVSDDWLDTGHGPDASRLATVFSRTSADAAAKPNPTPALRVPRSAGPVSVAVLLAAVVLVGSAGAVYAIRESLFPSLRDATSQSVWQNPAPPEPLPAPTLAPDIVTSTTSTTATRMTTTVLSGTVPSTASSAVSSTTVPDVARTTPTNTIDDHDSGGSGTGSDGPSVDDADRGADNSTSIPDDSGSISDTSGSGGSGSGSDDVNGSGDSGRGSDDAVHDADVNSDDG